MGSLVERLKDWIGDIVVVDCVSPYVAVGRLSDASDQYLELHEADIHDLRDTETTRELYLVKTALHGVQKNRKTVILRMDEVVGVSRLGDVVTG